VRSVARPPRPVAWWDQPRAFSIVGVFVARQTAEDRLAQERHQRVLRILSVRQSSNRPPLRAVNSNTSSSSRYASRPASEVMFEP